LTAELQRAVSSNEELSSGLQAEAETETRAELRGRLTYLTEYTNKLETSLLELQSSYDVLKASRVLRTVGAPIQRLSHSPVRALSSSSASSSSPVARSATQEVLTVSSAEDATIPRLRSELQRASEEISSLQEQVSESNAKLCVADREISELEDGKITDLVCRIHEWQIQLQLEQSKSADLKSELEEAIEELNKAYDENEELRRQVCTLLYMP
jgi:chromosome segregation ATPase